MERQSRYNGRTGSMGGVDQSQHIRMDEEGDDIFKMGVGFQEDIQKGQQDRVGLQGIEGEEKAEKVVLRDNITELDQTFGRKVWVAITYMLTFLVPSFMLRRCGMKREDVRMAWREKVAICIIIVWIWIVMLFLIIGLGLLLCPKQNVYTTVEVGYNADPEGAFTSVRGKVYDITNFVKQRHGMSGNLASTESMMYYAGYETNASFPLEVRVACPDLVSSDDDPNYTMYLSSENIEEMYNYWVSHKVGSVANSQELSDVNFYFKYWVPKMQQYYKGELVWDISTLESWHKNNGMYWRVINGEVYNFDDYFYTSQQPFNANLKKWNFLDKGLTGIIDDGGVGTVDISDKWAKLSISDSDRANNLKCMRNLFYVGRVDTRKSTKCLFMNYMLLAFACLLVLVVLIKFMASLQFGTAKKVGRQTKFVLCQVPCYTEGEESMSKTINSLANMEYDDKKRLIMVICDGNIVGSGNEKSTPKIVLDLLGVDPEMEPPSRDAIAVAEGSMMHNRGKVYSGLYDYEGHLVPFVVVVKVGNRHEKNKPGNRGKRDSQILLMRFLNKVYFELPMTPLELELNHHMTHIIGIPPQYFEYLLQVDADTVVGPESMSRLVAHCVADNNIAGICGETRIANEQNTWVTMVQVYEYYISHFLSKSFESLFGSVTCLPGCFCMYRLVSSKDKKPILINKQVVDAYSERHVDTLHKKNLLSLGEDRYLTTLMLRQFPHYKLKFARDAFCYTTVPESWSVLLSQRRRWINSTVHNLLELIMIENLCGFCCFSMRFVVFLDLFGTVTMPTVLLYFIYLLVASITKFSTVGFISLIILGAVYGLQVVVFLIRGEWQHIGWLIIYLLSFPLWSFVLPIYSFWHFDDFSWGNTRTVVGERGKIKLIVANDYQFNIDDIPLITWSEYEANLIALGTVNSPPQVNPSYEYAESYTYGNDFNRFSTASPQLNPHASVVVGAVPQNFSPSRASSPSVSTYSSPPSLSNYQQQPSRMSRHQPTRQSHINPYGTVMESPNILMSEDNEPRPSSFIQPQQPYRATMSSSRPSSFIQQQQQLQQQFQQPHPYPQHHTFTPMPAPPPAAASIVAPISPPTPTPIQQTQHASFMRSPTPQLALQQQPVYFPSDQQIIDAIKLILSQADLTLVSKKIIRDSLSAQFGVDMTPKKSFISQIVDLVLSGNL